MKYRKFLNENGLTLIEILAAVVIASILTITLTSILLDSTNNQKKQLSKNIELNAASYALKVITKDFRMSSESVDLSGSPTRYIFNASNEDKKIIYQLIEQNLYRNDSILISNVHSLKIESSNKITLKFLSGYEITTQLSQRLCPINLPGYRAQSLVAYTPHPHHTVKVVS